MLKKTITYPDLDGNLITEDFYFNLNRAEIAEMELSHEGGFSSHLQRIIDSKDGGEIMRTFKQIIVDSVGRRSEDGKRFVKSPEIANEFLETEAYSELFVELITSADAATQFVMGIVPNDLHEAFAKGQPMTDVQLPEGNPEKPAYQLENREPTKQELMAMEKHELQEAFEWKAKLDKKGE